MSTENGKLILSSNPTDMLEQARTYLQRVQLALRESTDFNEILDVRDRGELFRQYSRQQKYGIEIQNTGAEIKIRAERRMGELLREMKEGGELQHGGDRKSGGIHLKRDSKSFQPFRLRRVRVAGIVATHRYETIQLQTGLETRD